MLLWFFFLAIVKWITIPKNGLYLTKFNFNSNFSSNSSNQEELLNANYIYNIIQIIVQTEQTNVQH